MTTLSSSHDSDKPSSELQYYTPWWLVVSEDMKRLASVIAINACGGFEYIGPRVESLIRMACDGTAVVLCTMCGINPVRFTCSACHTGQYCSRECARKARKSHMYCCGKTVWPDQCDRVESSDCETLEQIFDIASGRTCILPLEVQAANAGIGMEVDTTPEKRTAIKRQIESKIRSGIQANVPPAKKSHALDPLSITPVLDMFTEEEIAQLFICAMAVEHDEPFPEETFSKLSDSLLLKSEFKSQSERNANAIKSYNTIMEMARKVESKPFDSYDRRAIYTVHTIMRGMMDRKFETSENLSDERAGECVRKIYLSQNRCESEVIDEGTRYIKKIKEKYAVEIESSPTSSQLPQKISTGISIPEQRRMVHARHTLNKPMVVSSNGDVGSEEQDKPMEPSDAIKLSEFGSVAKTTVIIALETEMTFWQALKTGVSKVSQTIWKNPPWRKATWHLIYNYLINNVESAMREAFISLGSILAAVVKTGASTLCTVGKQLLKVASTMLMFLNGFYESSLRAVNALTETFKAVLKYLYDLMKTIMKRLKKYASTAFDVCVQETNTYASNAWMILKTLVEHLGPFLTEGATGILQMYPGQQYEPLVALLFGANAMPFLKNITISKMISTLFSAISGTFFKVQGALGLVSKGSTHVENILMSLKQKSAGIATKYSLLLVNSIKNTLPCLTESGMFGINKLKTWLGYLFDGSTIAANENEEKMRAMIRLTVRAMRKTTSSGEFDDIAHQIDAFEQSAYVLLASPEGIHINDASLHQTVLKQHDDDPYKMHIYTDPFITARNFGNSICDTTCDSLLSIFTNIEETSVSSASLSATKAWSKAYDSNGIPVLSHSRLASIPPTINIMPSYDDGKDSIPSLSTVQASENFTTILKVWIDTIGTTVINQALSDEANSMAEESSKDDDVFMDDTSSIISSDLDKQISKEQSTVSFDTEENAQKACDTAKLQFTTANEQMKSCTKAYSDKLTELQKLPQNSKDSKDVQMRKQVQTSVKELYRALNVAQLYLGKTRLLYHSYLRKLSAILSHTTDEYTLEQRNSLETLSGSLGVGSVLDTSTNMTTLSDRRDVCPSTTTYENLGKDEAVKEAEFFAGRMRTRISLLLNIDKETVLNIYNILLHHAKLESEIDPLNTASSKRRWWGNALTTKATVGIPRTSAHVRIPWLLLQSTKKAEIIDNCYALQDLLKKLYNSTNSLCIKANRDVDIANLGDDIVDNYSENINQTFTRQEVLDKLFNISNVTMNPNMSQEAQLTWIRNYMKYVRQEFWFDDIITERLIDIARVNVVCAIKEVELLKQWFVGIHANNFLLKSIDRVYDIILKIPNDTSFFKTIEGENVIFMLQKILQTKYDTDTIIPSVRNFSDCLLKQIRIGVACSIIDAAVLIYSMIPDFTQQITKLAEKDVLVPPEAAKLKNQIQEKAEVLSQTDAEKIKRLKELIVKSIPQLPEAQEVQKLDKTEKPQQCISENYVTQLKDRVSELEKSASLVADIATGQQQSHVEQLIVHTTSLDNGYTPQGTCMYDQKRIASDGIAYHTRCAVQNAVRPEPRPGDTAFQIQCAITEYGAHSGFQDYKPELGKVPTFIPITDGIAITSSMGIADETVQDYLMCKEVRQTNFTQSTFLPKNMPSKFQDQMWKYAQILKNVSWPLAVSIIAVPVLVKWLCETAQQHVTNIPLLGNCIAIVLQIVGDLPVNKMMYKLLFGDLLETLFGDPDLFKSRTFKLSFQLALVASYLLYRHFIVGSDIQKGLTMAAWLGLVASYYKFGESAKKYLNDYFHISDFMKIHPAIYWLFS